MERWTLTDGRPRRPFFLAPVPVMSYETDFMTCWWVLTYNLKARQERTPRASQGTALGPQAEELVCACGLFAACASLPHERNSRAPRYRSHARHAAYEFTREPPSPVPSTTEGCLSFVRSVTRRRSGQEQECAASTFVSQSKEPNLLSESFQTSP